MKEVTNTTKNKVKNKRKASPAAENKQKETAPQENKSKIVRTIEPSAGLESSTSIQSLFENLNPSKLQQAIVLSEILNKPACKRRRRIGSR